MVKQAKVQQTKVQPTYLKGKKPVKIAVHDVMNVLKMIDDHGHLTKFKKQAKATGAFMSVHPETVNFVKDFVANNEMHGHPTGKEVVNPCGSGGDPYDCNFGKK